MYICIYTHIYIIYIYILSNIRPYLFYALLIVSRITLVGALCVKKKSGVRQVVPPPGSLRQMVAGCRFEVEPMCRESRLCDIKP